MKFNIIGMLISVSNGRKMGSNENHGGFCKSITTLLKPKMALRGIWRSLILSKCNTFKRFSSAGDQKEQRIASELKDSFVHSNLSQSNSGNTIKSQHGTKFRSRNYTHFTVPHASFQANKMLLSFTRYWDNMIHIMTQSSHAAACEGKKKLSKESTKLEFSEKHTTNSKPA